MIIKYSRLLSTTGEVSRITPVKKITPELVKKFDPHNVYGSVISLAQQVEDGWEQAKSLTLAESYCHISNVVVSGMGGSALGARLITSLFANNLKVPLDIVSHYDIPGFVTESTLFIASSYSGTTEEVIAATAQARKRQAKIVVIATGGTLVDLAKQNNFPVVNIDAKFNPCGQPRTAVGYSVIAQLAVLEKARVVKITADQILATINLLINQKAQLDISQANSDAIRLATHLTNRFAILVASEHLTGAVWTTKNQLNETAKTFSVLHEIPELNHHLMEGLQFPSRLKQAMLFVLYDSKLYHQRVKRRYDLTKLVIEKQNIPVQSVKLSGNTQFEQAFEVLGFGTFVTYYLAMLHQVDPSKIPWVDWFKAELGK